MSLSKENKVIIDGQTYYGGLNQPNLKFIKVNVDCWEKIFDFLSLRDVLAMSQTCQRMRQIGGHYFRENFHGTLCQFNQSSTGTQICARNCPIERDDFLRFLDTIFTYKLDHLRTWSSMDLLSSLTTLHLLSVVLNEHQLRGFENIQKNIETIRLTDCPIGDDFVGEYLASCPKLKCLGFCDVHFKSTATKASLFQHIYPTLERIEYFGYEFKEMAELIPFFKRNPSIKCLGIDQDQLKTTPLNIRTIQMDYLDIGIWWLNDDINIANRLKTLHSNGFFKKLRLSIHCQHFDSEPFIREMISFNALEALYTRQVNTNICHLTQLKELHLTLNNDIDLDEMATNLNNLERVCIFGAVDQLLSFLRHSKKLKFVIFSDRVSTFNTLDLFNLNHVRSTSGMRQTIQIGFEDAREERYLALKWMENGVNYDLVKITRYETIKEKFTLWND